jgi:hypothetical protein
MRDVLDDAIDRIPVGVDIKDGHEDGNLEPPVVEILILRHLFDGNDRSVGWGDHEALRVVREAAVWAAEEVQYEGKKDDRRGGEEVKKEPFVDRIVDQEINDKQKGK